MMNYEVFVYSFSPNVLVRFSDMNSFGFLKHVPLCPEDGGCMASQLFGLKGELKQFCVMPYI